MSKVTTRTQRAPTTKTFVDGYGRVRVVKVDNDKSVGQRQRQWTLDCRYAAGGK